MQVLITGGTGFVGSHVCRELLAQGHKARLLVRDVAKAERIYASQTESQPEFVVGDVTDTASITTALAGCDAVVHAAATTPLHTGSTGQLRRVNVDGVENIVGLALQQGIERIVCVSSITAIFSTDGSKVTADAEPVQSSHAYGQSKAEAERLLRKRQDEGAPLAIVYPGGVIGVDDPGFSDSFKALKHRIENSFSIIDDGGMQYIDVRDLAAFVVSLVSEGGQGRFLLPGVYRNWSQLADIVESVCGKPLDRQQVAGWKLRLLGRVLDVVRKFKTLDTPVSAETMRYATQWPEIKNTDELAKRGLRLRDPAETFRDAIYWMVHAGHLDKQHCPAFSAQTHSSVNSELSNA